MPALFSGLSKQQGKANQIQTPLPLPNNAVPETKLLEMQNCTGRCDPPTLCIFSMCQSRGTEAPAKPDAVACRIILLCTGHQWRGNIIVIHQGLSLGKEKNNHKEERIKSPSSTRGVTLGWQVCPPEPRTLLLISQCRLQRGDHHRATESLLPQEVLQGKCSSYSVLSCSLARRDSRMRGLQSCSLRL